MISEVIRQLARESVEADARHFVEQSVESRELAFKTMLAYRKATADGDYPLYPGDFLGYEESRSIFKSNREGK